MVGDSATTLLQWPSCSNAAIEIFHSARGPEGCEWEHMALISISTVENTKFFFMLVESIQRLAAMGVASRMKCKWYFILRLDDEVQPHKAACVSFLLFKINVHFPSCYTSVHTPHWETSDLYSWEARRRAADMFIRGKLVCICWADSWWWLHTWTTPRSTFPAASFISAESPRSPARSHYCKVQWKTQSSGLTPWQQPLHNHVGGIRLHGGK